MDTTKVTVSSPKEGFSFLRVTILTTDFARLKLMAKAHGQSRGQFLAGLIFREWGQFSVWQEQVDATVYDAIGLGIPEKTARAIVSDASLAALQAAVAAVDAGSSPPPAKAPAPVYVESYEADDGPASRGLMGEAPAVTRMRAEQAARDQLRADAARLKAALADVEDDED